MTATDRAATRQMKLVAFLQASNCSNYPASWRHPHTARDFLTPEYFQRIARTLEAGKFHLAFFDDRLAMPDRYGDDMAEALRQGIRVVKMDLIPLMTAMGLATSRIGLGGTYSTTYFEPFHVARVFSTLDHMIGGRAAWNVVTSLNDSEAANFGRTEHPPHDRRYDRADEFMEVVLGNWDAWEDGSVLYDRDGLGFADPARVHRLDYEGEWFRTRGTFTVPWTPQGRPVVIQAGQSGRGREFAARWGEILFVIYPSLEFGRPVYRDMKAEIAAAGRDPDQVSICPAVYCITGETRTIAEDKAAFIEGLATPLDTLVLLAEVLNFDFAAHPLDEPLTAGDLESMTGLQAIRDRVVQQAGEHPTPRDFVNVSRRGTVREMPLFVGTPSEVADGLQEWFEEACDGFVVAATHIPGAYEDFVRLVVPELQRRGIFHRDYAGPTLRENLGLPFPTRGDWKQG